MTVGFDRHTLLANATSPRGGGGILDARLPPSAGEDTRIGGRIDLNPVREGAFGALFGLGGGTDGPGTFVGEGDAGRDSGGGGAGEEGDSGEGRDGCGGECESHRLTCQGGKSEERSGEEACENCVERAKNKQRVLWHGVRFMHREG